MCRGFENVKSPENFVKSHPTLEVPYQGRRMLLSILTQQVGTLLPVEPLDHFFLNCFPREATKPPAHTACDFFKVATQSAPGRTLTVLCTQSRREYFRAFRDVPSSNASNANSVLTLRMRRFVISRPDPDLLPRL